MSKFIRFVCRRCGAAERLQYGDRDKGPKTIKCAKCGGEMRRA